MTTTWPVGVPSPNVNDLRIIPSNTLKVRRLESGRTEIRRFSSGEPFLFEGSIEMSQTEYETFCQWYDEDHQLGTEWSEASWLDRLGFSSADYLIRLVTYPRAPRHNGHRATVSFNLFIQDRAKVSVA